MGNKITEAEFISGIKSLRESDKGMVYRSAGSRHRGAKYDSETGERLWPSYEPARLEIGGKYAEFFYSLMHPGLDPAFVADLEAFIAERKANSK